VAWRTVANRKQKKPKSRLLRNLLRRNPKRGQIRS
jgi:hypothetical protein